MTVKFRRSNKVGDEMGRGGDYVLDKFLCSPNWYSRYLERITVIVDKIHPRLVMKPRPVLGYKRTYFQ